MGLCFNDHAVKKPWGPGFLLVSPPCHMRMEWRGVNVPTSAKFTDTRPFFVMRVGKETESELFHLVYPSSCECSDEVLTGSLLYTILCCLSI